MPICITCSTPVRNLYTTYSKADDRSLGKGVRLTQCPNCRRFADKYVEHDFVVLFIDLVLIKPQVYRHLLFNRLGRSDDTLDPTIVRLGTLLLLFDVYLTWAQIEQANTHDGGSIQTGLSNAPILLQYLFFLSLNTLATLAHHMTIRLLVRLFLAQSSAPSTPAGSWSPEKDTSQAGMFGQDRTAQVKRTVGPGHASPSAISTALLVSSCTKLFPILLVIWPTDIKGTENNLASAERPNTSKPTFSSRARSYVGWAVLVNNIEALLILLDCGYVAATGLALAGAFARWFVEATILGMVGMTSLDGDSGPIGFVVWTSLELKKLFGFSS